MCQIEFKSLQTRIHWIPLLNKHALIPIADMINYSEEKNKNVNCKVMLMDNRYSCVSTKTIESGSFLQSPYLGNKKNWGIL